MIGRAGAWVAALALAAPGAAVAQAQPWILAFQTPEQATLLDVSSRKQVEVTLSFNVALLRKTPAHLSGMDVYWGDGVLQIECLDHHTRLMLMTGYTLDRTRKFDEPSPAFRPWTDNADGTQARVLENYLCRGQGAANFAPIADLGGFVGGFLGDQAPKPPAAQVSASQTPTHQTPTPRAPADVSGAGVPTGSVGLPGAHPPPKGLSRYVSLSADEDGASLIDMTSTQRQGQIVSMTEYDLEMKPFFKERPELRWIEAATQFDCAGHRLRSGTRAWLTLDAKSRVAAPPEMLGAWRKVEAGTSGETGEALLCHGKRIDVNMAQADDLDEFQQVVTLALARRAKK